MAGAVAKYIAKVKRRGVAAHVARPIKAALRPAMVAKVSAALRAAAAQTKNLDELVDLIHNFRDHDISIAPIQIRSEIVSLLTMLQQDPPAMVLEVGTAKGGTLFLFSRIARDGATLISLDLQRRFNKGGPAAWRVRLLKSLARAQQRLELVPADSHHPATLDQVKQLLNGRAIDFLFIDGDHSYDGVKRDFEMYAPLVRAGGLVAFHDIVPGPEAAVGGVPRFWQEIKQCYHTHEFVEDWNQQGLGLGVVVNG